MTPPPAHAAAARLARVTDRTYRFGDFEVDAARYEVRNDGQPVPMEPKVFDLLHHLLEHRDRVVPKDELVDAVWGSRFVSESALTTALRAVRRALGDSGGEQRMIRTSHGRGYRFVAPVTVVGRHRDAAAETAATQEIRFCRAADDTRIAYASVGSGAPLVKAANWITHLDLEWSSPVWSHWMHGLARGRRLIRYDERGCGLSDWDVPSFGFDDWVSDLETVVDATGLERFPLIGVSQGGAVALAYAARHPERVSRLILVGAYARGRAVRADGPEEQAAAALDIELARVGWAREDPSFMRVFASQFLPDGSQDDWDDFTEFQRRTTSGANALRFLEEFARIDVTRQAPLVQCPTLILHSRDDVRVPASQAGELATLIPDSRLVLLDSRNHLLSAAEPAWPKFLDHVDAFLGEEHVAV